ncbi:MAG: 4-hydroxy-tetrahydrodipicolinate reductase [Hyphomicrobiales bacterium]
MKIVLVGYGKMGKEIEKIALERGHQIIATIDNTEDWTTKTESIQSADVAIEFSVPKAAYNNICNCINSTLPVVVGTTGWYDHFDEIVDKCKDKGSALLYGSNFSIGVNIFFEINKKLSKLISQYPEYSAHVEETHHTEKLDAPSGTAISIGEQLIDNNSNYNKWELSEDLKTDNEKTLPIKANRIENIPGTHSVTWDSEIDEINISHRAKSRKGFALGAVLAAEFIHNKKGVFTMKDLLDL